MASSRIYELAKSCRGLQLTDLEPQTTKLSLGELAVFVAGVLSLRALHIFSWPQILWGMSKQSAALSKDFFVEGFSQSFASAQLLPPVILSGFSWATGDSPGRALPIVVLLICGFNAFAFWRWVHSLNVARRVRWTACSVFAFLPFYNGYTGLGSLPTMLAGALALCFVAYLQSFYLTRQRSSLVVCCMILMAIPSVRSEYVLLIPVFITLVVGLGLLIGQRVVLAGLLKPCLCLFATWIIGCGIAIVSRDQFIGQANLADGWYQCWTFLDGTPKAWLTEDANSEYDRRLIGMKHFGHPVEYDYSLPRMVLANPLATSQKALLSFPRWFEEIWGRDQVVPRPAGLLAAIGVLFLMLNLRHERSGRLFISCAALILCTTPIMAVMLYAEYLRLAYPSVVLLIAFGIAALARLGFAVMPLLKESWLICCLSVVTCAGMSYLYFRSEANLPKHLDWNSVANQIDVILDKYELGDIAMVPYWENIDALLRHDFQNQKLRREYYHQHGRDSEFPPRSVEIPRCLDLAAFENLDSVVTFSPSDDDQIEGIDRISKVRPLKQIAQHKIEFSDESEWLLTLYSFQ